MKHVVSQLLSLALVGTAVADGLWPTNQTLTLDNAVQIALADNPSLMAAQARIEQARARLLQARAAYWPTLGGSASYRHSEIADNLLVDGAAFAIGGARYGAALEANWVLFDGLSRRFAASAARAGQLQSQAAMHDARRQLLEGVLVAFYGGQLARENVSIAEADEAFNRRLLEDARARVDAGAGSLGDALNFEIRANAAQSALIRARWDLDTAMTSLAALMGVDDARLPPDLELEPLAIEDDTNQQVPDLDALGTLALTLRPDLVVAQYAVDQGAARRGQARDDAYPSIQLQATVNGERADDPGFESGDFGQSVGGVVRYTFSDGGARRGRVREAEASEREARRLLDQRIIEARAEVARAIANVRRAQEQLALQRANTRLVERARDLVEKGYAAGQESLVRLNEAQRDLTTALSELALARVSLHTAWATLDAATGKILERYPQP